MDAQAFLKKHGRAITQKVCERSVPPTSIEYFVQLASGHRRPSVDLALGLEKASQEVIEDKRARLDFVSLLRRKERAA